MLRDIRQWLAGTPGDKRVSRETLNHGPLIEQVSGLDVYAHTQEAYLRAYAALGIDFIARVPLENAPPPTPPGQTRSHPDKPYLCAKLGVYDTATRVSYPSEAEFEQMDIDAVRYEDLVVPPPHPFEPEDVRARQAVLGDVGLYCPMLYTTLFMWAVEVLGWETFMFAAAEAPAKFHDRFLVPLAERSRCMIERMTAGGGVAAIMVHDDLADARGPVFPPDWYDRFIFPHYPRIFEPAKRRGVKVIFVADGNMSAFLPKLIEAGVDGMMVEYPATPLEAQIEHFGQKGRYLMGGIDTVTLSRGTPDAVRRMVMESAEKLCDCPGWSVGSCGGLHEDIPLANLEAYFDARVEFGATPADWRTRCRA